MSKSKITTAMAYAARAMNKPEFASLHPCGVPQTFTEVFDRGDINLVNPSVDFMQHYQNGTFFSQQWETDENRTDKSPDWKYPAIMHFSSGGNISISKNCPRDEQQFELFFMDVVENHYNLDCEGKTLIDNPCNNRTINQIECDLKTMALNFIAIFKQQYKLLCELAGKTSDLVIDSGDLDYYFKCEFNTDRAYCLQLSLTICTKLPCLKVSTTLCPPPDVEVETEAIC